MLVTLAAIWVLVSGTRGSNPFPGTIAIAEKQLCTLFLGHAEADILLYTHLIDLF